tara:strand:+ start:2016 stop:2273 length:258 start_codon:yes stop_codon:yes gene_type:complete
MIIFFVPFLNILTADFISSIFEAPVERITGLRQLAIFLIKGMLVISEEEILNKGTNGFRKLTDSKSKGVDKKSIFNFLQYNAKFL